MRRVAPCSSVVPLSERRKTKPVRLARLALLAVVLATGCEGGDEAAAAPADAGSPEDRRCEPILCRNRGLVCRGGDVVRLEGVLVSPCDDPTLACPEGEVVHTCERGCPEGATASSLDMLCDELRIKNIGDACATSEDCTPNFDPLGCDVERGVCILIGPERCNGFDDDLDGTADESCDCHPRVVASLPHTGVPVGAVFAPGRIALLASDAAGGTVQVIDAEGAELASYDELPYARSIAYQGGELVTVLQVGDTGSSTLVRLHEDGSDTRVTLQRTAPGERTWVMAEGDEWLLVTPVRGTILGITRHAATGERLGWNQVSGIFDVTFVERHGAETLVGTSGGPFSLGRLEPDLQLVPVELPPTVLSPSDVTSMGDSLLLVASTPEGRVVVATRDASGTFTEHVVEEFEYFGGLARVASDGEGARLGVLARERGRVRVVVLRRADLTRVGEIEVVSSPEPLFALGDPGTGMRLVLGHPDRWEVLDPCPADETAP